MQTEAEKSEGSLCCLLTGVAYGRVRVVSLSWGLHTGTGGEGRPGDIVCWTHGMCGLGRGKEAVGV